MNPVLPVAVTVIEPSVNDGEEVGTAVPLMEMDFPAQGSFEPGISLLLLQDRKAVTVNMTSKLMCIHFLTM